MQSRHSYQNEIYVSTPLRLLSDPARPGGLNPLLRESDYNRLYSQADFYGAGGEEQEGNSLFSVVFEPNFPSALLYIFNRTVSPSRPIQFSQFPGFPFLLLHSLFPYSSLAPTFYALLLPPQNSGLLPITFIRNMGRNMSYFGCTDLLLQAIQMI